MTLKQLLKLILKDQMIRITAPIKTDERMTSVHKVLYVGRRRNLRKHKGYRDTEVIGMYSDIIANKTIISIVLDTVVMK